MKKIFATLVAWFVSATIKEWGLRRGLASWQATLLASAAGLVASAVVLES
jgi:hypothetical protein